jgi:hypothetical protein
MPTAQPRSRVTRTRKGGGDPGRYLTAKDLADATGVRPATILTYVYNARIEHARTGVWPTRIIPKPDRPADNEPRRGTRSDGTKYRLEWLAARPDVQAFMDRVSPHRSTAPKAGGGKKPSRWQLRDKDWLHDHYVTKQLTCAAIAKLVDPPCTRDTVVNALERAGIPITGGSAATKLAGVTLKDLQADVDRYGVVGTATRRGVNDMTVRRTLRRLKTEAVGKSAAGSSSGSSPIRRRPP